MASRPGSPHDTGVTALEVVRSGSRPTLDDSFALALQECYARHGVQEFVPPVAHDEHPLVRLVVVRDDNGVLLGGGRVHARHSRLGFPAETTLRHFPEPRAWVRGLAPDNAGELSALWVRSNSGGVARLLVQACIATAISLGMRTVFTLSHEGFGGVLATAGMMPVTMCPELPLPAPGWRARLFAAELPACPRATRFDREIISTIAAQVSRGAEHMLLNQLTSVEQGYTGWTIRRTTARLRGVA